MHTSKPWEDEPDLLKWIDQSTGYHCVMIRSGISDTWLGYVKVPRNHKWYRKTYHAHKAYHYLRWPRSAPACKIEVHGGLTFSGRPIRRTGGSYKGHWFGFDTAHYSDLIPAFISQIPALRYGAEYRDVAYVKENVTNLAAQLKEYE